MTDEYYMKKALELAEKGRGFVSPNPMVGAVIVKNGKIIGKGYHEKYGTLHAERRALENCDSSPEGATMYVTLEPCCHYGKTPPCTEAIIESKISKVVVGSKDSNPLVAGKGIYKLRENGIEVLEGILEKECDEVNQIFFHYIKNKKPYVVMKYAMTMDGKIATKTGKSKWITGEKARQKVHLDRHKYKAIMIGVNTVIADNPLLTCRLDNGENPIRIICDTNLRTPIDSKIVTTAGSVPTIIATSCKDLEKHEIYKALECEILVVSEKNGHIDLNKLMTVLGEKEIDSILLEGGSTLNWSALESNIVNKIQTYIAPKIFGGIDAKTPVAGIGIENPNDCFFIKETKITMLGEDILIESEVVNKCLLE